MTARMRLATLFALLLLSAAAATAAHSAALGPFAAARTPQLTAAQADVPPGGTLTLQGTGFPQNAHLALLAGPPKAAATRIGGAVTGRRGAFTATIRVRTRADAGPLVVLACHDGCRVSARVRLRIVAP